MPYRAMCSEREEGHKEQTRDHGVQSAAPGAKRLEDDYPSAAGSVREGLDETLTVLTLHLSTRLQRSLATTNAAESLLSRTRHVKRNVKRWRGGQMMLRWVAAGVLEAVKGFRRLKGRAEPRCRAVIFVDGGTWQGRPKGGQR